MSLKVHRIFEGHIAYLSENELHFNSLSFIYRVACSDFMSAIYIYVCVCMHINIYIGICTHIHTYIYTHVHTHIEGTATLLTSLSLFLATEIIHGKLLSCCNSGPKVLNVT